MPSAIEFPTSSLPGQQPSESQGVLQNAYAEVDAGQQIWKRVPGTRRFTYTLTDHPRGMMEADGFVYAAYEDVVLKIDANGAVVPLANPLEGTERVSWSKNNADIREMVVVTNTGVFQVTTSSVITFEDEDLPTTPTSVCSLDGYFLFTYANGTIFASELNSVAVEALSFTKAEANPDGLLRGIVSGRQFYAMGSASIEVYQNVGTVPFPLARVAVIPVGLMGTFAVAGGSDIDGWDAPPLFVAADGTVRMFDGYAPKVVSTRAVERSIAQLVDKSEIDAYVYTFLGHSIFGIRSGSWCWEFNISTGQWHERHSFGSRTWRGYKTVRAFGKWLCGDTGTQELRYIDSTYMREQSDIIPLRIESKAMKNIPDRLVVPRADFVFAPGVGVVTGIDPIQTDPRVEISWSDDGGGTWSRPLQRTLGRMGKYAWDVRVNRTGMTTKQGRRWRIDCPDPADFLFFGATMDVEPRAT